MRTISAKERLIAKIHIAQSGCWEYLGSLDKDGYGWFYYRGKMTTAHRVAFLELRGSEIPADMCVCHTCDNRKCINPDHLFLGSHKENMQDKMRKGRGHSVGSESSNSKLTEQDVLSMRQLRKDGVQVKDIAAKFRVSASNASRILRGVVAWKHI